MSADASARRIVVLAASAFVVLAAEPLFLLVDTAVVGHLGRGADRRVSRWVRDYPDLFGRFVDSDGRPPRHTFFYPIDQYDPMHVDALTGLCRGGFGEIEVHLHHDHDTAAGFSEKIRTFTDCLRDTHGLLHTHHGRPVFGFIHGNWALDNSRPDGRWCGVAGELQLLRDLGCYADFTMPSLPSPTQSRILNQIYWTTGDPGKPRGFDRGVQATVGGGRRGDLLMITGPTGIRYRDRLLPRLDIETPDPDPVIDPEEGLTPIRVG